MNDVKNKVSEEIVLIKRPEAADQDIGSKFEQIAKILSLVAIPIVIAVVGWMIQSAISQKTLGKDYVQIAVSILGKESKKADPLREWAVDLLNDNSPTKFTAETARKLKSGELSFTEYLRGVSLTAGSGLLIFPDGKTVATGHRDGTVRIWDIYTGRETKVLKIGAPIFSLALTADRRDLVLGSSNGTVYLWNIESMVPEAQWKPHEGDVIGIGITPDGKVIITRSRDGSIVFWDRSKAQVMHTLNVEQSKNE